MHRTKRFLNVFPEARTSEILCKPNAGTKSPVDEQFIRGLTAGREAVFVPGCRPVDRRLFVSVNPFHARRVRESVFGCCTMNLKFFTINCFYTEYVISKGNL